MNLKDTWLNFSANLAQASPTIKIVVGIVGLVGAGVFAAIASTKVKEETEEQKKELEDIQRMDSDEVSTDVKACYSKEDRRKDICHVVFGYAKKFVKLYGIPFVIAILSVLAILNGAHVLNTRLADTSALLATTAGAFEAYRDRLKDRFGEEDENELYYAGKYETEEVEVNEVDEEGNPTGKTKTVTQRKFVLRDGVVHGSPYAFLFDETCSEWTNDISCNESEVTGWQFELQRILDDRKPYVTFGDLCDTFGKKIDDDPTYQRMSMKCGWRHGDKIDFRAKRVFVVKEDDGVRKDVPYILLDPNVRDIYGELVKENQYNEESTM